jgi:outer membrane biosynthesis protein TonB
MHPGKRRAFTVILAVAVPLAAWREAEAQASVTPARAEGIREARGTITVVDGLAIMVAATSDGFVELTVTRDTALGRFRQREPRVIRALYPPAAVDRWLAQVDTLRTAMEDTLAFRRLTRTAPELRDGDGIRFYVVATQRQRKPYLGLTMNGCRGEYVQTGPSDIRIFPSLFTSLARAADDARRAPNAAVPARVWDGKTYFEHAVGCPAEPMASNAPAVYPQMPAAGRHRREVLAEFVVDSTGLVDPSTVRFPQAEDPRFTAAARSALATWRFTKPTRAGFAVRQLSHQSIVFEPPVGDSVDVGCVMGAQSGAVVRPLTERAAGVIDRAYLAHIAEWFPIWFGRPSMVGTSVRFVIHHDGKISDAKFDRQPADTARVRDLAVFLQSSALGLDPLPPGYPWDGIAVGADIVASCDSPRRAMISGAATTFTPLPDGTVEVARRHPNWKAMFGARETIVARDVVPASVLQRWLDTTWTLLPSSDGKFPNALDRWSGSLADIPVLGSRGNRGLIIGLGTQGQLHGGVSCGEGDESIYIQREDLAAFWRVARDALAARESLSAVTDGAANRVYDESEVACPALPAMSNTSVPYPESVTGDLRVSHEVLVAFTVDTLGVVERGSIATMPGANARFAAVVRRALAQWQFRPAMRGGRRVRQRTHLGVVVRPPEADAALLASKSGPADPSSRTIFHRKNP